MGVGTVHFISNQHLKPDEDIKKKKGDFHKISAAELFPALVPFPDYRNVKCSTGA